MAEIKKLSSRKKSETKNPFAKLPVAKIGYIVVALVFTISIFAGLLFLQDYLNDDIIYVDVITAKKDIKQGEIITKENVNKYFTISSINQLTDVSGSVKDASVLINQRAKVDLLAGEVICDKDFKDLNSYTDDLKNPVQVAIASKDLASFDGGTIRAGDLINISIVQTTAIESESTTETVSSYTIPEITEEEEDDLNNSQEEVNMEGADITNILENAVEHIAAEETPIEEKTVENAKNYNTTSYNWKMDHVYVSEVKDSSGVTIPNTDTTTATALVMITIEKEDAIALDNALNNSSQLRLAKVLYE